MRSPLITAAAVVAAAAALALGCTARRVTVTERSAVEQELLVRALERAIVRLETARLERRRVALELFALTKDQAFAQEFLAARLRARGVDVVADEASADLRLKVFASVLGIDRGETLLGLPALQLPVVSVPIPEIAFFKWIRHRSQAEIQIYAFDRRTGQFLARVPDAVGRAKYDEFTVLILVSFTVSDLDERPDQAGPGSSSP